MKTNPFFLALFIAVWQLSPKAIASTIPFELAGNLIIIKGWVDGQYGNFILDTGVPNLILNKRYFDGEPSNQSIISVSGQVEKVGISYPKLEIEENLWKRVYAEVIPMTQLEGTKSIPIHGLLGTDLFRGYILFIDHKNKRIELFPLDKKGGNEDFLLLPAPSEVMSFKNKGGAPLINVQIKDQSLGMTIDTGAELNLIGEKWEDKVLWEEKEPKMYRFGGLGQAVRQAKIGYLSDLQVGTLICRSMRMGIVQLDRWNRQTYGPSADGILGYEFLKQFWVAINFKRQELYLWGNTEPLDRLLAAIRK